MRPTTIRLDEATLSALDSEYGQYGYSDRSDYIRAIIEHRDPPFENTPTTLDYDYATTDDYERLRERVADLEGRIADVEAADSFGGLNQQTDSDDAESLVKPDAAPDAREQPQRQTETPTPDVPETVPQRIDDADASAAIAAAVDYIEDHGSATMRDLVSDVMPDHDCGYEVPALSPGERYRGSWWRKIVRPGLEDHPAITKPRPGQSEWRSRD